MARVIEDSAADPLLGELNLRCDHPVHFCSVPSTFARLKKVNESPVVLAAARGPLKEEGFDILPVDPAVGVYVGTS